MCLLTADVDKEQKDRVSRRPGISLLYRLRYSCSYWRICSRYGFPIVLSALRVLHFPSACRAKGTDEVTGYNQGLMPISLITEQIISQFPQIDLSFLAAITQLGGFLGALTMG
jgi:hypothetical protein